MGFGDYAIIRIIQRTVPSLARTGWNCHKLSNFARAADAGGCFLGIRFGFDLMILGPVFWQQEVHSRTDDAPGATAGVFGAAMGAFFGKHGESLGEQNGADGDVHPDQRPYERGWLNVGA